MIVSEITLNDVAGYLKLKDGEYTQAELQIYLNAAVAFLKKFTGFDAAGLDEHEDLTVVTLMLCHDMYENRSLHTEKRNMNQIVEIILTLYNAARDL
ncbi:phage gp6-like head-tail connector protein [Anoxybacterium hadale]|uniref:Phage gp6-like head-tail connector protein n=1 Tax=Anoxybacterium hadale TaxID=3408580 RepID=A0ACD1ABY8_9FIRM|nr:phage gp6-like head-tail connector protein [Clostridiales bacterium]